MDIIADNEGNSQLDIDDASYVEGNFINKIFVMILHTLLRRAQVFSPISKCSFCCEQYRVRTDSNPGSDWHLVWMNVQ